MVQSPVQNMPQTMPPQGQPFPAQPSVLSTPSQPSQPSKPSLPSVPRFKLPPLKLPLVLAVVALVAVALGIALIVFQQRQNRVVKTQDGITVTAKEAQEELDRLNKIRALSKLEPDKNLEPAIESAFNKKRIYDEASKRGISVTDEEINQERKNFGIWTQAGGVTADDVVKYGWTEDDIKEWVRTRLLQQKLADVIGSWIEYQYMQLWWEGSTGNNQEKAETLLNEAKGKLESGQGFNQVAESLKEKTGNLKFFYTAQSLKSSVMQGDKSNFPEREQFFYSLTIPKTASIYKAENEIFLYYVQSYHQGIE